MTDRQDRSLGGVRRDLSTSVGDVALGRGATKTWELTVWGPVLPHLYPRSREPKRKPI